MTPEIRGAIEYSDKHLVFQLGSTGALVLGSWEAMEKWNMMKKIIDQWFELEREFRPDASIFKQKKE